MANAGFTGVVEVSSDGTSWTQMTEASSADFEESMADLDVTAFTDENIARILGLGDSSFSIEAYFDAADAGQNLVRTQKTSRSNIHVRYLVDGTNGFAVECICTNISFSGAVDGVPTVSYDFVQANGGVTVVS